MGICGWFSDKDGKTGDFKAMIKNPSMAIPFVKSFELMTKI